jgi:hypothetical protein
MKGLQEMYSKYKFMETRVVSQKRGVSAKIPDIKNALSVLEFLIQKKEEGSTEPMQTRFKLADTVHMDAELTDPKTVFLWLGVGLLGENLFC